MHNKILVVCLLLILIPAAVFASEGTTGKLTGKVTDKATGEPLPAVNVIIRGTTLGASSDENGNFIINNIPAATYVIEVSYIGYETMVLENVRILADYNTKKTFAMVETQIEGEVVVVTAERPLIQQDVTNTVRITDSDEMKNLPTRGTGAVVSLQTGVVEYGYGEYRVRGGRGDEVTYIVDGFEVQSYYGGGSSFSVNDAAISQLQVSTGGFNAEYGRQMSGSVNVVTKSGSPDYHGSVQAISDLFAGAFGANNYGYNIYDFSLSGGIPFTGNKATFYFSGERQWEADRAPRPLVSNLRDDELNLAVHSLDFFGEEYVDPRGNEYWTAFPDGRPLSLSNNSEYYQDGRLPNNDLSSWKYHSKINYRLSNSVNIEAGLYGRKSAWKSALFRRRYDLRSTYDSHFENRSAFIRMTHTLSPKTFYTLGVNHNFENNWGWATKHKYDYLDYRRKTYNDYDDLRLYFDPYRDAQGLAATSTIQETHFTYLTFKGDITSQINLNHQLQAGFDFQRHTLRSFSMGNLNTIYRDTGAFSIQRITSWGLDWPRGDDGQYVKPALYQADYTDPAYGETYYEWDPNDPIFNGTDSNWDPVDSGIKEPKHPSQLAVYLQDKIEYEGLVINAGIRFDYYNPDAPAIADYNSPLDYELESEWLWNDNESRQENGRLKLEDSQISQRISPRIGLGFPVTDRTLLHVNYGKFYQMPTWNRIIIGYDTFEDRARRGSIAYTQNPRLKPETTTAYEAGVTQQLGEYFRFDFTAFYKDVLDLVIRERVASLLDYFSQYKNGDFATLKGFDIGLTLRRYRNISMGFAYSLQYALGTGSTSNSNSNVIWIGATPPSMTYPLDYDQRHKISVNFDYRFPRDGGPTLLGKKIFADAGINVVFSGGSGFPYTPIRHPNNEISLEANAAVNDGPINSSYGPWLYDIDLRASKLIRLTSKLRVNAYVWALNVTNRLNPYNVYRTTGDYRSTGWLDTLPGKQWLAIYGEEGQKMYEEVTMSPFNFRPPRQVRFGLELIF